ncbi:MAG: hypothetical protein ACOYXU_14530 [Nitrospirota bacterium]
MSAERAARFMGRLVFATGFMFAVMGLTTQDRVWLRAGVALLVTGIAATGYALYRRVKDADSTRSSPN